MVQGTYNDFVNCHPWGYPKTYPQNTRTAIPFYVTGGYNNFVNCYGDTPELLDDTQPYSVTNGGIGFYNAGAENNFINCLVLAHASSKDSSLVGYWNDLGSYGSNLIGCKLNLPGGSAKFAVRTLTNDDFINHLGCNFNNRNLLSKATIFKNFDVNVSNLEQDSYNLYKTNESLAYMKYKNADNSISYFKLPKYYGGTYTTQALTDLKTALLNGTNTNHPSIQGSMVLYDNGTIKKPVWWTGAVFVYADGVVAV
jgi:hypothetical protein